MIGFRAFLTSCRSAGETAKRGHAPGRQRKGKSALGCLVIDFQIPFGKYRAAGCENVAQRDTAALADLLGRQAVSKPRPSLAQGLEDPRDPDLKVVARLRIC